MARTLDVLLVDSDPQGRDTLSYGFQGNGFNVETTSTWTEAAQKLAGTRPHVAVIVMREPVEAALEFIRQLPGEGGALPLPVVTLGPAALRAQVQSLAGGAGAGMMDFLPLPAFVRDAITATRLRGLFQPTPGQDALGEVHGALSDFGFFFLVRAMIGLGRTGIVQVERANRRGEVRFLEGEIVSAQVGSLQGSAALHQLLLWDEAMVEVKFRPVARRGQPFKKGEDLLEEIERFLRDFAHATKDVGAVQSLFVQDAAKAAESVDSIPAEVVPVLRLFDGQRTLGDVLEDSPFRVFDTLRIAGRLLDASVIRRKAIEKPTGGAAGAKRPHLDEWLSRGRDAEVVNLAGGPTAAPSEGPTPAGPSDQRSGPSSRRKSQRRDKPSAKNATLITGGSDGGKAKAAPPSSAPSHAGPRRPVQAAPAATPAAIAHVADAAPPPPAAAQVISPPAPAPAASGELRVTGTMSASTSGELSMRGELRAPQRGVPAIEAPSVVVDLAPEELESARTPPPVVLQAPRVLTGPSQPAAVTPPVVMTARPVGPASPPVPGQRRPSGVHTAVINAVRSTAPSLPAAPAAGPSIQLDPSLVSEMDEYEFATSPPTPPPDRITPRPTTPPPVAPATARRTPETPAPPLSATPSPVSFVGADRAGFTPPLTPLEPTPPRGPAVLPPAPVAPTPSPMAASPHAVPVPTAPPAIGRTPSPVAVAPSTPARPASATPPPVTQAPAPAAAARTRRPSGEFNALEADFFAREADLYKDDAVETFDDLDRGNRRRR